jgi:protein gp37
VGEITGISWCDHTFNPWIGCQKVSPACDGCYAEAMMGEQGRYKRVVWGQPGMGAGTRSRTSPANWKQPLAWNRKAERDGTRPFVFCASLADVFDNQVPPEWRRDLFALIRATPNLTWLLLTKRPQNIVKLYRPTLPDYQDGLVVDLPFPSNAAIGCTVVTQAEADRDVPVLLGAKAALRPAFSFLSMEPLLGLVDLTRISLGGPDRLDVLTGRLAAIAPGYMDYESANRLDWIITGGETDQGQHKARLMDPEWARLLRDQCRAAGVPFHLKQMTRKAPIPADLQVQERPSPTAPD